MKLPFPYALAAEFTLFQPPPQKVTFPHLWIVICSAFTAVGIVASMPKGYWLLISLPIGLLVGFVMGFLCYRVSLQVLPFLYFLVSKGIIREPDSIRLAATISSFKGRRKDDQK
jgi:hypothetical protein